MGSWQFIFPRTTQQRRDRAFVAAAGYAAAVEALTAGKRFGLDQTRMLAVTNVSTGHDFNTEVVLQEHVVR